MDHADPDLRAGDEAEAEPEEGRADPDPPREEGGEFDAVAAIARLVAANCGLRAARWMRRRKSATRATSASLLAMPKETRTRPTACPVQAAKRCTLKPSPRMSRQRPARRRPKASSEAPGLQKQPPRSEMFSRRALSSTSQ